MAGSAENGSAPPPFKWTGPKRRAVELLAADELTDAEVASAVGTAARTLWAWKANAEFGRAVQEAAAALGDLARRYTVGRRAARLRELERRRVKMCQVIEERGDSPQMQDVPGGKTGLLAHTVKAVGRGDDFRLIDLYEVDTALLKELREHERQAAQELGQWSDKHQVTGADGKPLLPSWEDMAKMSRQGLLELYRELARGVQP